MNFKFSFTQSILASTIVFCLASCNTEESIKKLSSRVSENTTEISCSKTTTKVKSDEFSYHMDYSTLKRLSINKQQYFEKHHLTPSDRSLLNIEEWMTEDSETGPEIFNNFQKKIHLEHLRISSLFPVINSSISPKKYTETTYKVYQELAFRICSLYLDGIDRLSENEQNTALYDEAVLLLTNPTERFRELFLANKHYLSTLLALINENNVDEFIYQKMNQEYARDNSIPTDYQVVSKKLDDILKNIHQGQTP